MSERDEADVVRLDERARDKLKRKRQDERADALASQFHRAMGWAPDKSGGKKGKGGRGKKKRG